MKKLLITFVILSCFSTAALAKDEEIAIEKCELTKVQKIELENKLKNAENIISELQKETAIQIENGYGPFLAAIYDENGNLIAKMPNTVIKDQNCLNHAEMNTIKEAQRVLGTYDLAPHKLSIYISAEPCIMCTGGIMWSGIKEVYYSVSSKDVEDITGFDEGYKPNWKEEFEKRGIKVYGPICEEQGKNVLRKYVVSGKHVYKPSR